MNKLCYILVSFVSLISINCSALPREPGVPVKCLATLAGAKYPELVRAIPNDYAIKVFYETFGNARRLIVSEFKAGRTRIGVNGLWSDTHSFGDADIPKIQAIGKDLQDILNQFPDREIKFRPFTEHKIARPDKYLDIAQKACPSCIIVNSNWQGGFTQNTKYENEVHGSKDYPKALLQNGVKYNYDYDGASTHDSDRKSMGEKHAASEEFCDWTFDFNLKISEKDNTPRPNRTHYPNIKMIESLMFYTQGPKATHNDLPAGFIFKHCAERHTPAPKGKKDPEPRACTPVIIAPVNGKNLVCAMKNGKKLFSMSNVAKYQDNERWVYRPPTFQSWGYDYAKQALKQTGSPLCTVTIDGVKRGTLNPGWRDKDYRS